MSSVPTIPIQSEEPYLDFLWLEITSKCNLECSHCYTESSPRNNILGGMRTTDWFKVIEEAADLGCRKVQFIGGEPTLHPELWRLISFASQKRFEFIEIFTNATNLSEKVLRAWAEYNVHVATSFYSDDCETHDRITKQKGSFDRTVSGIKKTVAAGVAIRAGIIEMEENLGHAARAKRFLEELGVAQIQIDHQRGVGRGARWIHSLDPIKELCGQCWKGKLCVTAEGTAYPCIFARFVDLGPIGPGVQNILMNYSLLSFRNTLREHEEVGRTAFASSCRPTCAPGIALCLPVGCQPNKPSCQPSCIPSIRPDDN